MPKKITVAILGSTGYVGLELVRILSGHKNVEIKFLGTENNPNSSISSFDNKINDSKLPLTKLNNEFDCKHADTVFLALPHGISNAYVKNYFNKIQIVDLSADFRLDDYQIYKQNYGNNHQLPHLLNEFVYGLPEINREKLRNNRNIAIPGCYPTSVLTPLSSILDKKLIKDSNIIIDSKSGYSGAGKKFEIKNIKNSENYNFFNYNTNNHRHICEIKQELEKINKSEVCFSFNPHILPNFRGMMSTIYCDLVDGVNKENIENCLVEFESNNYFIEFINNDKRADFFNVQNTNKCIIKLFNHYNTSKIIIVSLIDNLQKGAAGQAVQCFNISNGFDELLGFNE